MQVTLNITGEPKAIAGILATLTNEKTATAETTATTARTTKRAAAKAEETEEEFDLDGETETTEEVEASADDETETEAEEEKTTLDDVVKAFQKYAAKYSREKAGKILAKFKVKSVRDIPAEKYDSVMKMLGA